MKMTNLRSYVRFEHDPSTVHHHHYMITTIIIIITNSLSGDNEG
jgi:hypothetical protein